MTTTIERIRAIFEEHAGPEALKSFGDTGRPWKTRASLLPGDLDSLDRVDFLMSIEDEFKIEISDAVAVHLETLEDIARHVDIVIASRDASPH